MTAPIPAHEKLRRVGPDGLARLDLHHGGPSTAGKDLFVAALTPNDPAGARALREHLSALEPLLAAAGLVHPGNSTSREPV